MFDLAGPGAGLVPVLMEAPVYPLLANQAQIQGTVRLKLLLDPDGTVSRVEAESGNRVLIRAAIDNAKLWRFAPAGATRDGHPTVIEFTYIFRLDGTVNEHPTTRFRYEHPYRAVVTSQALHWTPTRSDGQR
jgi:TonB family protein